MGFPSSRRISSATRCELALVARWLPPALLGLALPLALACTPPEERAERAREAVEESIARGDRAAALDAIGDLRRNAPDTADAQLELAQLLIRAGNAPEAGWLLEDAAREHPGRADLAVALARVSLLLGNPARAREVADRVAPEAEQFADALVLRAQAELQLGQLERALATLGEAERLFPDRPEARLVRIATLYSEQRRDEARTLVEETRTELAGDDEATVALRRRLDLTLAQLQAQQGESGAALASLDALLADDPGDLMAWQALVLVLVKDERADAALARVEAALAAAEPPPELFVLAAQMHAALGDDEAAEAALRTYVERSESAAAYLPLVDFHSTHGDAEATLAVLDEALARFPDEASLRLQRTEALVAEGNLEEARAESRRFRENTFADDPQIEYLRARIELADGDAKGAADRLRRLAPRLDVAATHYWLGRAFEAQGDLDGARRRYALAEQRDPHSLPPSMALLAWAMRRGDWRAAVGQAKRVVRSAPGLLDGWTALVEALVHLGEGERAEAAARQSIEAFPERVEPRRLLARALRGQARYDEALAELATARAEFGPTPELEAEQVLTLGMAGRVNEGIAAARDALASSPDSARLHGALASLLFAAGAAEDGARAVDRALELDPDDPSPLRVRCEFRTASGRLASARDDCTRYLAARPDDAGAHFMLGVAHEKLGESEPAIAAHRRAAQLDERDMRPRNNLAELLAARGDVDGALAAAQEAYRLDEQNPYVKDTLGALYLRKGLPDRAVSLLEEAHAGLPELGAVTLHLAIAYRDAGRTTDARTLLVRLQESDAENAALQALVEEALDSLP